MRRSVALACLFALFLLAGGTVAQEVNPIPAPPPKTDGLVWTDNTPKVVVVGAAGQIKWSGTVDTVTYKNGFIFDKNAKIEVFEYDVANMKRGKSLYTQAAKIGDNLRTFGTTTARNGGFPPGIYDIEVSVQQFQENAGIAKRPAILIKGQWVLK